MDSRLDKFKFITQKVILLVNQNKEKEAKINQLSTEVESLSQKLNALNQEIQTVKNENENLKMIGSPSETTNTTNTVSQKEIDKMIKEIDECLALINI
jgi:outer membrane murein-binding lipoprotein Lpp